MAALQAVPSAGIETPLPAAEPTAASATKRARPPTVTARINPDETVTLEVSGNDDDLKSVSGSEHKDCFLYAFQTLSPIIGIEGQVPTKLTGEALQIELSRRASQMNAALAAVAAMQPRDELEAMIAVQATAMHHVAMDCLARAMTPGATIDGRTLNLSQANKSSRTFAALVETLNRHRGKVTTQKVIVENVNVSAGGQAVVGAVSTPRAAGDR
jgi:hypothetical protein